MVHTILCYLPILKMKHFCNLKVTATFLLHCLFFAVSVNIVFAEKKSLDEAIQAAHDAKMSESEINRVLVYGYDIRVSATDVIDLLEILTDVRNQGFPIDTLLSKIDEGLAKRVSFIVLKAFLKKKIRDYRFVLDLFNRMQTKNDKRKVPPALLRVADSLDFGLSYDELESLFHGIPDVSAEMWAVAALNTAFLEQLGFDPLLAVKIMRTGLKYKSLSADWEFFFKIVEIAAKKGVSDQEIADAAVKILINEERPNELLKQFGLPDHKPSEKSE